MTPTGLASFVVVLGCWPTPSLSSWPSSRCRGEPAPVYGTTQIELAWTLILALIVLVLFLSTARVIRAVQDRSEPAGV